MQQTDVNSTHRTTSGAVTTDRARLKSISYRGNGTAGYVRVRDGSVTGTILVELDVGTSDTFTIYVSIPGEGVLFPTSIYVQLSNVDAITAFWA
jgi:hypothetical protein